MSADPTLPASLEGVRELPEEITKAKGRYWTAARHYAWKESEANERDVREASAALDAAILSRLNGAKPDFWVKQHDALTAENYALKAQLSAALARAERLEKALEPFATFGADNVDEEGWGGLEQRASIHTWFGPSEFRAARDALSSPAPTEEG